AAALNADTRRRRDGEIRCHGERGAAVEREGRAGHASVTQGKQRVQPPLLGSQDQLDGIRTVARGLPFGVSVAWTGLAQPLAERVGLFARETSRRRRAFGRDRLRRFQNLLPTPRHFRLPRNVPLACKALRSEGMEDSSNGDARASGPPLLAYEPAVTSRRTRSQSRRRLAPR